MDERTYANFDLLLEPRGDHFIARVVDSPAGQASAEFQDPFQKLELENLVLRMGHGRGRARRIDTPEMQAVKIFGERLFKAVFQEPVYTCYMRSVDQALSRGSGLRVRLHINVPRFNDLPWEFLFNPYFRQFMALSRDTPIIRYFDSGYSTQALPVELPVQVLVMLSSPPGYPELDLDEEWKHLNEALRPLIDRGQVALHRLAKPTLKELQRYLRVEKAHILHFIGHGRYFEERQDGTLLLEDETGRGIPTSGQHLGAILHDHHSLRLVVLNACEGARTAAEDPYAGVAQTLVQQGIPAVLAMQFEIYEEAAQTLAQEFYGALADGYPVDAALSEARKAIFASNNDVEWGTPVLFTRIPDGILFKVEKPQVDVAGRQQKVTEEPPPASPRPEDRQLAAPAEAAQAAPAARAGGEKEELPAKPVTTAREEAGVPLAGLHGSDRLSGETAKPKVRAQKPAAVVTPPQATEAQRKSARAHLELGARRERSGIYKQAIAEYTTAIELDPQDAGAYIARGVLYSQKQRTKAALADFARAIELDPGNVHAYTNRGMLYFSAGQYEEAAADLSKAAELDPADAQALNNRGAIQAILDQDDAALADYSKALRLDPALAFAWANRGVLYSKLGRHDEAIADFSRAIQLNLEQAEFFSLRSVAFSAMGMSKEAKADLREYERLAGKGTQPVESWFGLQMEKDGVLRQFTIIGRPVEAAPGQPAAEQKRGKQKEEQRQQAQAHVDAGLALLKKDKYEAAIAGFSQAIQIDPDLAAAYFQRGNAHAISGSQVQAIADFSSCIKLNPRDALAYYNRGNSYLDPEGDPSRFKKYGLTSYTRPAYQFSKDFPPPLSPQEENCLKAIQDYSQAIEIDPGFAWAYNNRGLAYMLMRDRARAFSDFSRAIEIDPRYAEAYHNRSQAYGKASGDPGPFQDHQKYQQLTGSKMNLLGIGLLPAPNK